MFSWKLHVFFTLELKALAKAKAFQINHEMYGRTIEYVGVFIDALSGHFLAYVSCQHAYKKSAHSRNRRLVNSFSF